MTAVLACVCLGTWLLFAAFVCGAIASSPGRPDGRAWEARGDLCLAASCLCALVAAACLVRVATENLSP